MKKPGRGVRRKPGFPQPRGAESDDQEGRALTTGTDSTCDKLRRTLLNFYAQCCRALHRADADAAGMSFRKALDAATRHRIKAVTNLPLRYWTEVFLMYIFTIPGKIAERHPKLEEEVQGQEAARGEVYPLDPAQA